MKTGDYWASRSEARERAAQEYSGKAAELVRRAYNKAFSDIEGEIRKILKKYPDLEDSPASWRAARLREIQANAAAAVKGLGKYEADITAKTYADVMRDGYYRFLYDVEKGLNLGFNVAQIPESAVKAAIDTPWAGGRVFSQRVWGNSGTISEKAGEVITAGLMSGATVTDMAAELAVINSAGKYAAERLIRTETNYFCNRGELLAYNEAGIEEYQYLATLDNRTSEMCIEHDGNVYKVSEAKVGENYPPLHPFCRSTTVAWFGKEAVEGMERRARDPETGKLYTVPADMSYKDWRETFVGKGFTNSNGHGIISIEGDNMRGMANGLRRSPLNKLADDEIAFVKGEIEAIGADLSVFRFNEQPITGYFESNGLINIAGNVFPDELSSLNRDTMSVRAVIAHEYYGHKMNRGRVLPIDSWEDEFRASYRAAVVTPNLTDKDRASLFIDAYERARQGGKVLKMTKEAINAIFGY